MSFSPPLDTHEVEVAFAGAFTGLSDVHRGGQGAVFRARDSQGHDVAVKIYYPGAKHVDERSDREIEALRRFNSPTIVTFHASGDVVIRGQPCPYLATGFVDGVPITGLCHVPLPRRDVVQIGLDVATAIRDFWKARRVHRDLSPNNIMWTPAGRAVVIDLGLVRHAEGPAVTTAGIAWGTPGYLSPEQAEARRLLTCKCDIFTLGVVLVECLAGRHPSRRDQGTLIATTRDVAALLPGVPRELTELLQRMLHVEAVRRPSPDQVISILTPILATI